MALADMLPTLDDAALLNLRSNAVRLAAESEGVKREAAAVLLPLIEAEIAAREASKPPKIVKRVKRKAATEAS